jgi:hypothetical protein
MLCRATPGKHMGERAIWDRAATSSIELEANKDVTRCLPQAVSAFDEEPICSDCATAASMASDSADETHNTAGVTKGGARSVMKGASGGGSALAMAMRIR